MKEFDFDELDKAVGSVLASTGQPAAQEPVAATSDPAAPTPNAPEPHETSSTPAPAPIAQPVSPRPTPTVTPTRRSGKFMDVVHPGANNSTSPAPTSMSRSGVPVQPVNPSRIAQDIVTPSRTPAVAEPVKLPEAPERAALDTLDTPTAANDENSAASPAANSDQPSFSPFIPDAKVEKRPLGAFSALNSSEDSSNDEVADEPKTETAAPASVNLPPELNTEVVALESQDDSEEDGPSLNSGGQGAFLSIPQQYASAPSEDDNTPHQVFDTEQYHPALTTATQPHKHTWLWVTLAAVILLVAAGIFGYWFVSGL